MKRTSREFEHAFRKLALELAADDEMRDFFDAYMDGLLHPDDVSALTPEEKVDAVITACNDPQRRGVIRERQEKISAMIQAHRNESEVGDE